MMDFLKRRKKHRELLRAHARNYYQQRLREQRTTWDGYRMSWEDYIKEVEIERHEPPLYIEAFLGYRCWWLDPKTGQLSSSHLDEPWSKTEPMHAECGCAKYKKGTEIDCEECPGLSCRCGFYAFKSLLSAWEMLHEMNPHPRPDGRIPVLGTVWLWGKIIEHEDGYRAEYAQVATLQEPWDG